MQYKVFESANLMAHQVATLLHQKINSSPHRFNLAISGGSTPLLLFDILASQYAQKLNWQNLGVFWVDERCVPPNHSESNYGEAYSRWLSKVNIPAQNIFRMQGEATPEAEAQRYGLLLNNQLGQNAGFPQFDLILLGMGDDGHTASIFPPQLHLMQHANPVAVGQNPYSGQNRITLTGNTINAAAEVLFLVTGQNKASLVKQIAHNMAGCLAFPAAHIKPVNENVTWYLDSAAASQLR